MASPAIDQAIDDELSADTVTGVQPASPRPRFGYEAGQPFGDPSKFTRSTREDEIDRFNQWMRGQPWYAEYEQAQGLANRGPNRGFSDDQQRGVEDLLRAQGINLPGAFHVDEGGNINQKSRTKRNLLIAAAVGGGLIAAPAIAGALGAGGAAGGAGATGAAGGAGAGASGGLLAATPAAFTGAGFAAPVAASGLGAAGATGLGAAGASTLAATTPALSAATLAPTVTPALGAGAGAGVGAGTLAATTPPLSMGTLAPTVTPALGAGGSMTGGGILSSLGLDFSNPQTYMRLARQLGRLGEGQAEERGLENQAGRDADRTRTSQYGVEQDARTSQYGTEQGAQTHAADATERGALDRAALGLQAPDARTRQSILGSLLQELQPFSVGDTGRVRVPTISGGLSPSALNADARRTGKILQTQAIDALLSGSDIPEATDFQGAVMTPPEVLAPPGVTPYQGPGRGESILSGIGTVGNIGSILANLQRESQDPRSVRPVAER